jgi:hypothetical protein
MGRRLMAAYESIKVVDEGIVDKVKGMFGKKAPTDGTGNLFKEPYQVADRKDYLKKSAKQPNGPSNVKNIFDIEPYKSDTKEYLKKSAKQPNGPSNVKNIFDK